VVVAFLAGMWKFWGWRAKHLSGTGSREKPGSRTFKKAKTALEFFGVTCVTAVALTLMSAMAAAPLTLAEWFLWRWVTGSFPHDSDASSWFAWTLALCVAIAAGACVADAR